MSQNKRALRAVALSLSLGVLLCALVLPRGVAVAQSTCTLTMGTNATLKRVGDSGGVEYRQAQSFIAQSTDTLKAFAIKQGANTGSPAGNLHYELRTSQSSLPGALLLSGDITPSAPNITYVTVANGPVLYTGITYWFVLYADAQASNVRFSWNISSSSNYADGSCWESADAGANWTDNSADCWLQVVSASACVTATPGATLTPSATPTPTTTPSPTPNYGIEITSTAGAPMKLERTATYGDMITFGGELVLAAMGFIAFAYWYWKRKNA